MFSVLIVDDDNNVRNGLNILISWEKYGFKIVDTAMDGFDALEKYKERCYDLIIVDMQMPRVDGLELISTIRRMDPFAHFLVLSGYAEFDYAKKSIEYRVDGYILKPVDEEELIEHLKRIKVILDREKEEKLFTAEENNWRCEMLIQSILSGNTSEFEGELPERAAQIGLSWPAYQVLLIQPEMNGSMGQAALVHIRRRLKQVFNNNTKGIVFRWETFHGVLLNNFITREEDLQQLYDILNQNAGEGDMKIFLSVGEPVSQIAEIVESCETAVNLLKDRFIAGGRRILSTESISCSNGLLSSSGQDTGFDVRTASEKLYYVLDIGNMDSITQLVFEWESRMIGNRFSEKTIKTILMQIISMALNKLSNANRVSQPKAQEFLMELAEIYSRPDLTTLRNFVLCRLEDISGYMQGGNNEALANKMKDIVERNYSDKLTLEMLAEAFNYGSGYLGRLFKKYTGENFNTYLDKMRILKAKELLQKGVKVYQVASLVGYSNVDYFHSKFKKYVGISPSHYRKEKNLNS